MTVPSSPTPEEEDALVARSLRSLARVDPGPLPSAGIVFRRLQVRGRLERERALAERALRPVRIAEVAAGLLVMAAGAFSWRWGIGHTTAVAMATMLLAPFALGAGAFLAARR